MKKPFETYLTFIENQLGVQLLCWQKMVLQSIYDGYHPYVSGVRSGKAIMCRAAELLREKMIQETKTLKPRPYRPDGYKVDILLCDDSARYNI